MLFAARNCMQTLQSASVLHCSVMNSWSQIYFLWLHVSWVSRFTSDSYITNSDCHKLWKRKMGVFCEASKDIYAQSFLQVMRLLPRCTGVHFAVPLVSWLECCFHSAAVFLDTGESELPAQTLV